MNGFTLLVLIALVAGIPIAFRMGMERAEREARMRNGSAIARTPPGRNGDAVKTPEPSATTDGRDEIHEVPAVPDPLDAERARLVRAAEREGAALRVARTRDAAELVQLRAFGEDRRQLLRELADARTETARYREIVVDLEDNAPPLLLDVPNSPDDLKLIVGVGPVLERMLQRMGVGSYRQIARWSEHDIDAFDARLPEFPGRIRRDGWVTQARALHQSKYGERAV